MAGRTSHARAGRSTDQPRSAVNQVRLLGRLADAPETRELPSGDEVVTFRLIVDRRGARSAQATVDTIDCTVWGATLRRRAASWKAGERLAVEGSLRRRFWRSPQGARSRYDVEVSRVSRDRHGVDS
jgi:single-strand DNA-binding protein